MAAATEWGLPTAPQRALCIHGLSDGSTTWYRVADRLASAGYSVVAPDILGHGLAPRAPNNDYSIRALTEALRPYITPPPDLTVAHPLDGVLALKLLPFPPAGQPIRVVVVDPKVEEYIAERPGCTREDVIVEQYIAQLCDPNVVWKMAQTMSFTIIAADPALGALFTADQVSALVETHPHIRVITAKRATHDVQRRFPNLVADVALEVEK